MNDQLTALLTELQSLRKEVTELKQIVKGKQPTQPEPLFDLLKPNPDKLPITQGLEGRITALLQSLKIPAHIKGYVYLREAIKMSFEDFGMVEGITKSIYPAIAAKYRATSARVERAIRHAIETSWKRNRNHVLFVHFQSRKPTNSEFIAMIADRFILEETELETAAGQN